LSVRIAAALVSLLSERASKIKTYKAFKQWHDFAEEVASASR
jgi:hypothetical protein